MYKSKFYRNFHKEINERLSNHIHKNMGKHVLKHAHRVSHHINSAHHSLMHFGELILVGSIGFMSLLFAGSSNLPNNTSFSYPLKQVSTLECRILYRNDMSDSCKINLPIIHGANYSTYKDNELYRSIYTTLRAASYSDSWNQKIGAHAGLDIATARGTPLYSIGEGEVYYAGRNAAYGNVVKIKYVYQGEIVYAVYAHMDTMDVKTGDKVRKGQKIGGVGNSGNTAGGLGGYHVHFEIDKDNFGRPAYSYTNCPDLSKGHYKIIQNGLCRTELFNYQYDPIRILESNSTYVHEVAKDTSVINSGTIVTTINNDTNNTVTTGTDVIEKTVDVVMGDKTNTKVDNTSNSDTSIDKWKDIIQDNTKADENLDNKETAVDIIEIDPKDNINSGNIVDINLSGKNDTILDDNKKDNTGINNDVIVDNNIIDNNQNNLDLKEDKRLLDLNYKGINALATHFLTLWDIEMRSELKERSLILGETITLDIEVFKKGDKLIDKNSVIRWFNGILQVPFIFMTSNDNIDIDVNYVQLITKGKAKVEITGKKTGKGSVIIEFGDKKIGLLDININ